MNKPIKWSFIVFTLYCFSQISFANTTTFRKELDDFMWSLGEKHKQKIGSTVFDEIRTFTNEHRKDYQKSRAKSLKQWQVAKINTSGFQPINSNALDESIQELRQSLSVDINENIVLLQHWRILNVESMTSRITSDTVPFFREPPLGFSLSKIRSLTQIHYLFGVRYATIPIENDVWEIWAYSQSLAFRYRWDIRHNQIDDVSIWIKNEYVE